MELIGGITVTIVRGTENLHTFTRTRAGADASWILTTPMSVRQRRKLPPEKKVDITALSLEEQCQEIWTTIERRDRRDRHVNDRVREYNSAGQVYQLGCGIRPVGEQLLWRILDGVAATRGDGTTIEVDELNGLITDRRGDRRK